MKATRYAASVHYVGNTSFEESKQRILSSLAFAAGRLEAPEFYERPISKPAENTIYLINKPDIRQSNITVMVPANNDFTIANEASCNAFSKYFGEGLGNIFFQEIREFRSMAYSAGASIYTPSIADKPAFLVGRVATQGDKTNDAVKVIFDLLQDMPMKKAKAEGVRNNLVYGSITSRPSDRYLSQYIEMWERQGYTEDPAKYNLPGYKQANIDFIKQYYTENIKGKPIALVIVGDKKKVDTKALKELGNYQYLNSSKLFNE